MRRRGGRKTGYILVEAMVALAILSLGAFVVHGTIRQAVLTRGQAQDYTRARFLLEGLVADLELQPELVEDSTRGRFEGDDRRFRWSYGVRRVNVPKPGAPLRPPRPGKKRRPFTYEPGRDYLARVRATVTWERGGRAFSESFETLLGPDRLWQPPRGRR